MNLVAKVDLGLCQGYASCVVAAPDVFDLDEESGTAVVKTDHVPERSREAVQRAGNLCPVSAISLESVQR